MKPEGKTFKTKMGDKEIVIETGRLAQQAGGSVTIRLGDSMIFAAATMGGIREGIDFFPLTVEYEERMYAGGRIPGSFFRREGRPGTDAILVARLTDRPLRPLFPEGMRNEVQVILMSLSSDSENPLDILAVNAASVALMISDIPWNGPIGAVRIGYIDEKLVINPTFSEMEVSALDLRVAGTRQAISMVECGANEVSEELMLQALDLAHKSIQPIIDLQETMAKEIGKAKREYDAQPQDEDLKTSVEEQIKDRLIAILDKPYSKENLYGGIDILKEAFISETMLGEEDDTERKSALSHAFNDAEKKIIRDRILKDGKRPDNRGPRDIREIWCEVGISPRAHGSAVFTRGETQAITLATLGTPKEAQPLDNLIPIETKRYMHHYNFPPYCVGEARRLRGVSRREIGHGALAERALLPVLPDAKTFPYTMRLVSEILASNGSSSMASVCGSSLSLMDAGVPIKAPVSGVAMGLIKEGDDYVILTDILGTEDHLGDMDFKVAGTKRGITALQMDIKISGITSEILSEALGYAKQARFSILDKMLEVIPEPNKELKSFTPRIEVVQVPIDKIGAIIGPGGKNIRALQEETNTKIDIDDDGLIYIAALDGIGYQAAKDRILLLTESAEIGRIYTGKCVRTTTFGAFIEILPGQDGLVHISQLASDRIDKVEDVVNVGDEISVMVTDISPDGKVRLSRKALLEGWTVEEARENDNKNRKRSNSNRRDNRNSGNRRNNNRR